MSLAAVTVAVNAARTANAASGARRAEEGVIATPFDIGDRTFMTKGNPWTTDILMYRGTALKGDVAVKVVTQSGRVRLALKPFDDLRQPYASKIGLWDAVVRPDGGVSYVGVVIHESNSGKQPMQLMAHYSATGVLTRVWDMHPYHQHLIAADRQNNIYAFGHRITGDNKPPYPLLTQYSEAGAVKATLLTAADIGESKEPDAFVDGGAHELIAVGDRVVLLLRSKNELSSSEMARA